MRRKKFLNISGLLLLTLVLLTACGKKEATNNSPTTMNEETAKSADNIKEDVSEEIKTSTILDEKVVKEEGYPITVEEAVEKFQETYNGAEITKISLDYDLKTGYVYKIKGIDSINEYSIKVDVETGDIVKKEQEIEVDGDDREEIFTLEGVVNWKTVLQTSVKEVSEHAYVEEWELSKDDGKLVYDFEVVKDGNSFDIIIDAYTNKILEIDD